MDTTGKHMYNADAKTRSEAARAMGSARTPAKLKAAQEAAAARQGIALTEEHKRKLKDAQTARRERERAEPDIRDRRKARSLIRMMETVN